jgi:hypothetical protein
MQIGWRDWVLSTIFRRKRQLTKAMAVASSSQNTYSNEKVKAELTTDF